MAPIRVRRGQLEDLDTIVRFNLAMAWETESLKLDEGRLREGVRAALTDPTKGTYYVAQVGDRVVGQTLITREWSDWRNGWIWWFQSVYTEPDYRRQGVFRALYEHVKRQARREGVAALRLYVMGHNQAARAVYQAVGMKPTGYDVWEESLTEG